MYKRQTLLRIDGASFAQAIDDDHARPELEAAANRMAVGRFIKSATMLGDLAPAALAQLAERVHIRHAPAGETVIRQGDAGDECYLVRQGELDVIDNVGSGERRLATLRTGMLFGEAALLTGAPRNATVRVTVDAEPVSYTHLYGACVPIILPSRIIIIGVFFGLAQWML